LTWIHSPEPWMIDVVAEALGLARERVEHLARRRTIRFREYHGLLYALLRREVADYPEGTVVLFGRGWWRVVRGYPPIQRMVLPSVALPRHFIDKIVVEEKMNGHNVRVVLVDGRLYAITRGGYICPYTTSRLRKLYGGGLRGLLEELGPEEHVVAGEVVGLRNPYTRYYYPEAPTFGYFVFDIFRGGKPLPPGERNELVEKHGLSHVRLLGVLDKTDIAGFKEIIARLDREGREGVVVKDPEYRVPPLKYTTSHTNIGDIRLGMRFFMEEGRSFLFSRILREIFRVYEEGVEGPGLVQLATELGLAVFEPSVETVRRVASGGLVFEEFEVEADTREEIDELLEYLSELGVDVVLAGIREEEGKLVATIRKMKDTAVQVRKILETGLSPMD
jgi:putative ATP-dependent DNA ligase